MLFHPLVGVERATTNTLTFSMLSPSLRSTVR